MITGREAGGCESLLITVMSVLNLHEHELSVNKTKMARTDKHGEHDIENATKLQHILSVTAAALKQPKKEKNQTCRTQHLYSSSTTAVA